MCVLLCANSKVREWLDMPLAIAHRQALQLCPVNGDYQVADVGHEAQVVQSSSGETFELDKAEYLHVMKRSAWLQAYCRYHMKRPCHSERLAELSAVSASSREWHKALEAIAQTWGRLLSLVGLRR